MHICDNLSFKLNLLVKGKLIWFALEVIVVVFVEKVSKIVTMFIKFMFSLFLDLRAQVFDDMEINETDFFYALVHFCLNNVHFRAILLQNLQGVLFSFVDLQKNHNKAYYYTFSLFDFFYMFNEWWRACFSL